MKRNISIYVLWISVAVLAGIASPAFAQNQQQKAGDSLQSRVIFSPGFFIRDEYKKMSETTYQQIMMWDVHLGYQFSQRWYLGMMYSYERERVNAVDYPIDDISTKYEYSRSAYGVSGGYIYYSYYTRLHYLFNAEWQVDENNESLTYGDGWGIQADVGINFELFGFFLLGPKLSFKHMVYTSLKQATGTSQLSHDLIKQTWDPYFNIWVEF
ncbi:MAG: hypothetical protein H6626_07595 [Pseudobdellovibrionaceae bacterium]|nr:hypothetical protein [Bdellovibrionales bacterium]USN46091.1 MAG: hypothetical protein H6626_07595 [Pseudobdellovibrionaceae bacterium]